MIVVIKTNNDICNAIISSVSIYFVYSLWNSQNQVLPRQTQQAKSAHSMLPNIMLAWTSCPSTRRSLVFHPFARSFARILATYISLTTSELSQFRQSAKTSTVVLRFPLSLRISPHELLGAWRLTRPTCLIPQSTCRSTDQRVVNSIHRDECPRQASAKWYLRVWLYASTWY